MEATRDELLGQLWDTLIPMSLPLYEDAADPALPYMTRLAEQYAAAILALDPETWAASSPELGREIIREAYRVAFRRRQQLDAEPRGYPDAEVQD